MRKRVVSPPAALAAVFAVWASIAAVSALFRAAPPGPAPVVEQRLVPDLNRAPPHHLILLPNLGPVRAAAIVAERARNGPFASLEDLVRVRGIGPKTVEGLRGLATAGRREPASPGRTRRDPRARARGADGR